MLSPQRLRVAQTFPDAGSFAATRRPRRPSLPGCARRPLGRECVRPYGVGVPVVNPQRSMSPTNAGSVRNASHLASIGSQIDHDVASYAHIVKLFVDGEPYGDLTRDDILDNITLSWLTNTGVSSARLYVEYKGAFFNDYDISVPAAVSVFPEEVYQAPRSWTERATTISSISTPSPKAGTLPPGNSRNSSQKRFVRASDRCANSRRRPRRRRDGVAARRPFCAKAETYVRAATTRSPPFRWDGRAVVAGRCVDWQVQSRSRAVVTDYRLRTVSSQRVCPSPEPNHG